MRLESNLYGVIARTERLTRRDIPLAMAAAVKPGQWRELAYTEAQRTLLALAEPTQRHFIEAFLRTLTVDVFGTGFFIRMSSPFIAGHTLAEYQAARSAVKPSDLGQNLFQKDIAEFEQLMTEWVETEKRKDRRDQGKSDEEIGNFISFLMLTPSPTPREAAARKKLMPHILDFLQRKQGMSRLNPEVVDAWLRGVLAAWRAMVRAHFQDKFRAALRAATTELPLGAKT